MKDSSKLDTPQSTEALHLSGVKFVIGDTSILQRDFPDGLANLSPEEIRRTVEKQLGVIARNQTRQTKVNTPIDTDGPVEGALRPRGYGRALVLPFFDGYVDGKGTGAKQPLQEANQNGLMSLGAAIREYAFEKLVHRILEREGYDPGTIQSYAVLDAGFDIVRPDGSREPAGILLRQSHARTNPVGRPMDREGRARMEKIEGILRAYGVTSNDDGMQYEWMTMDRNNIQLSTEGKVLDFGTYLVVDRLRNSPVAIDGEKRIPFETWGYEGEASSKTDRITTLAHEAARQFRDGNHAAVDTAVGRLLRDLPPPKAPCETPFGQI